MKSFVYYDKSTNSLNSYLDNNIPLFCKKCIKDENKSCKKYYKKLLNSDCDGLYECPYGFYSYCKKNNIYTSLILKDKNNKKLVKNIQSKNQKLNEFDLYTENQIINIMEDYDELYSQNIELRDCMHDLRNIGSYFNSMSETIEINHKDLAEEDEDIKAMLALYDLVNYRLNVFYGIVNSDYKRLKVKIYPIIKKLKIMMRYQARKKKINIKIDYEQENILILSKNIYLVMFILMENAIKHSKHNSDINIDFEESENFTIVTISNISPLIEENEYSKIFERGYRGKNSISKGTGIGLSLVKQVLDKYEYTYDVEINPITNNECVFNFKIKFPSVKHI